MEGTYREKLRHRVLGKDMEKITSLDDTPVTYLENEPDWTVYIERRSWFIDLTDDQLRFYTACDEAQKVYFNASENEPATKPIGYILSRFFEKNPSMILLENFAIAYAVTLPWGQHVYVNENYPGRLCGYYCASNGCESCVNYHCRWYETTDEQRGSDQLWMTVSDLKTYASSQGYGEEEGTTLTIHNLYEDLLEEINPDK